MKQKVANLKYNVHSSRMREQPSLPKFNIQGVHFKTGQRTSQPNCWYVRKMLEETDVGLDLSFQNIPICR